MSIYSYGTVTDVVFIDGLYINTDHFNTHTHTHTIDTAHTDAGSTDFESLFSRPDNATSQIFLRLD